MIEDSPLLQLQHDFPRPSPAQVAAFRDVPTGNVVDCMNGRGALSAEIKPVDPAVAKFCGVAVTCHAHATDNLGAIGGLGLLRSGDVLVCANDACRAVAVIGDLMVGMIRNQGGVAFITDGMVRDQEGIRAVGLPVFAAGVTPNSPARTGPGTAGFPVVLGGVRVCSGDLVVGDEDGAVVVPYDRIDAAIAQLATVLAAEEAMAAKVDGGLSVTDFLAAIRLPDGVKLR